MSAEKRTVWGKKRKRKVFRKGGERKFPEERGFKKEGGKNRNKTV